MKNFDLPESVVRVAYTVIEQATERIVITDRQGTIIYVNPAFEEVTGYTREEVLGQNPRIVKSGFHDEAFYRLLWETLLSGRSFHARFVNKRKTGELYHEEQTISPLKDKQGRISYFLSTAVSLDRIVNADEARKLADSSHQLLQGLGPSTGHGADS